LIGKGKLTVLGVFVLLLAMAAAIRILWAGGGGPTQPQTRPADTPRKPSAAGEFRGVSLQLHNGSEKHPYEKYVDEIAQTGANTICLVVTGYQENGSSTCIFLDLRKTPCDGRIKDLIAHARRRGLRVMVMPIVLLESARAGEWRGKIAPTSWDGWWADYFEFVLHYAYLAEEGGAEVFVVGSELVSTESQTDRWRDLIRQVRGSFSGRLCYSANWDHYRPIDWWDDLDILGMTTYYDLTGGDEPTVERLLESWEPIKKDILAWQGKINRPILFTEVGWPNQETAAQYPWDYYRSQDDPAPQRQANCFEAFFRTWAGEPAVAGFLVWEWRNSDDQAIGPEDTSYVPTGKPAMQVIRKYYSMPARSMPGSAPLPAPRAGADRTEPSASRNSLEPRAPAE